MSRWAAVVLALPLLLAGVWSIGFAGFLDASRVAAVPPADADGIVVLTGGADRIERALTLLAEQRAPVLLISGVGRGTDIAEMARRARVDPAAIADRVTLGHLATTTIGNAVETAAWAAHNNIRRLIVVTAGYHMPRALVEIARDLPDVTLYPVPVQPAALRGRADYSVARLLANEYDKLLAVRLGLNRLLPGGDKS